MTYVVGTAGHIDHGKSTLIQALTGIDPDRLADEKRRGMTIDLGFAYFTLPSGRLVGIVDVPGHARFIRNMLAGVHGLDAVLLVVAADEGVMPQTREHLDIVDLLEIRRGVVAVTKTDVVDGDWLELVRLDLAETLKATSLAASEIVPVSAVHRDGLDRLCAALDRVLEGVERVRRSRPRLPIDRVFTISGFGTVVTGTLLGGPVAVGEEMEVQPGGRRVRIRGLQQHGRKVGAAEPGSRVAANLAGIERTELARGQVLAQTGLLRPSRRLDVRARVVTRGNVAVKHGMEVFLHTGTAEVPSRVVVLDGNELRPGAEGWLQLYLHAPIAALPGDHFILRVPSPSMTVAGGRIVDVAPRRHARTDVRVVSSLERRVAGAALQEELAKYPRGVTEAGLLKASAVDADEAKQQLARLQARRSGEWLFPLDSWAKLAARAGRCLADYHAAHPLRGGMPKEELQSRLLLPPPAFGAALKLLSADGVLVDRDGAVARPGHAVQLDEGSSTAGQRLLQVLGRDPFAPPSLPEAMQQSGAGHEVVRLLAQRQEIVRLSPEIALTRAAYDRAVGLVQELAAGGSPVTVATLRDRMGASRRPVLALLEYLDAQKVTRRIGDARVLV